MMDGGWNGERGIGIGIEALYVGYIICVENLGMRSLGRFAPLS